ncbi:hypothetical protein [Rhodococcus marinonascens]|uniref:hypothetical protein n=1 Tax=Rhodococcus marinonascens TaxID=38311 RepID=UPI000934BBE1|nr:hypothetical protein [Rhodococcus marinonascens]
MTTADGLDGLAERLAEQYHGVAAAQDALAETWHGGAASAAATRVVRERSLGSAVSEAFTEMGTQFRAASGILDSARQHVVSLVSNTRGRGFNVHNDGVVDAAGMIGWLALAPESTRDFARLRMEKEAAELTISVVEALRQANQAATEANGLIRRAIEQLTDAGAAVVPTDVIAVGAEFSWKLDSAATKATTAASTIGIMTDAVGTGLKSAAAASGDDVGRLIGRGFGPFGAALGAVPAITTDIDGGMDPTKAVVSESVGAGVGLAVGTGAGIAGSALAGGAIGSVVPGAGTAAGLVVGAIAGGLATYTISKGIQQLWD